MVLGVISFLPFHGLKALGVPDGTIVAGALAAGLLAALLARRAPEQGRRDARLFAIPCIYYTFHSLAALAQLASGKAAFAGQMAVIAAVTACALVAYRFACRGDAPEPAPGGSAPAARSGAAS